MPPGGWHIFTPVCTADVFCGSSDPKMSDGFWNAIDLPFPLGFSADPDAVQPKLNVDAPPVLGIYLVGQSP
jgi:hypothetical protein